MKFFNSLLKASLKTCFFITNIDLLPQLYSSWICCIICILLYLTPIRAPFIWYFFQFTEYIKFPFNFFTLKLFRIHLRLLKRDCYRLKIINTSQEGNKDGNHGRVIAHKKKPDLHLNLYLRELPIFKSFVLIFE